ncbi:MAG: cbb3-type cytochrome c oxidase N-terminal domain-containing protein [Planctomycetota bacterium]
MADSNKTNSKAASSTLITGHEYDGIQEYDNPTPAWWHIIWLATIVLSVFYFYMSLWSPMFVHQTERLVSAQEEEIKVLFAELGTLENEEQTLLTLMDDEKWMTFGAAVYRGACVSCHGADAGGSVGPDMLDDYYINVASITDIHDIIRDGAAGGAMPAWGKRLHPNEVVLLSAYIAKLRGTGDGIRPPEGEIIAPWPARAEGEAADEPAEEAQTMADPAAADSAGS